MNNRRGRPKSGGGSIFQRNGSAFWWMRYRDREGKLQRESTGTANEQEANRLLRDRLDARDEGRLPAILAGKKLTLNQWADWFLERRSKPPFRSEKTHAENINALKFLRPAFGESPLTEVTADAIEDYIDRRLCSGRRVRTKLGTRLVGKLKPATVHQEFRILKRILNVAVKKKCLDANPCSAVEFPIQLRNATRKPHYMTASEQQRIEFSAPDYLRNAIVILAETGLRPYKELMPMKKLQVDMENRVVYIPDSKTPNGAGEMPIPDLAYRAFQAQIEATPASEYLFPTPRQQSSRPYIRSHQITEEDLGRDTAACWRAAFPDIRVAPYLCYQTQRRGSRGPFCHPNASAGRLGGIQAVQPGEAEHDARGIDQARPPG